MTEFEINFRPAGNSAAYVREGWGEPEGHGRWMLGPHSLLVIPPPPWTQGAFQLRAMVGPYQYGTAVPSQRLRVLVNGREVFSETIAGVRALDIAVPDGVIGETDTVLLFVHEDAVAPVRIGAGSDMRELAFGIWALTLTGPDRPAAAPPAAARAGAARAGPPVLHIRSTGNLGNRMIRFMAALLIQQQVPDCIITGVELDEWGLSTPGEPPGWADHVAQDEQRIDREEVVGRLRRPDTRKVIYRGIGARMENFADVETYRALFRAPDLDVTQYDSRHLVINVRAGDVLGGQYADYVLIPPRWYRALIDRTGLIPVFMGQLDSNPYIDALRAACPEAIFVPSQGVMRDFETIRRARNIAVAVSTFSWVAAWLSQADRIFLPVNGFLNPAQFPAVDLLPLDDPRYEFHLFPVNRAVPLDQLAAAHAAVDGQWRVATPAELAGLQSGVPLAPATVAVAAEAAAALPFAAQVTYEAHHATLLAAEREAATGSVAGLLERLRLLPLADFGTLMWSLPVAELPNISRLLPRMASAETQLGWTGKAGEELLQHTVDFCRIVAWRYQDIAGRRLAGETMLDFGFGYGRIARLMYWFTNPQNYYGLDPMQSSFDVCAADGVLGHFARIDYVPTTLATPGVNFGLIFAYSVFTHTSRVATQAALRNLRTLAHARTVLVITIRPVEHWNVDAIPPEQRDALIAEYRRTGFSFRSHGFIDAHGNEVYGETAMSREWIETNNPQWRVAAEDRGLDRFQTILFLIPS